jgi:hypothetical protein
MPPDFPSIPSRPQITPGNVQNQKRGGRGGKARKRRRRADGTWEEVDDDEEGEDDPSVELDGDSFRAKQDDGALEGFMGAALPWESGEYGDPEPPPSEEPEPEPEPEPEAELEPELEPEPPTPPPPPPTGRGTGGLQLPHGTGDLGPVAAWQQRRNTGSLGKPGQPAVPSPYLQGSWEYRAIDGRTGYPVIAVVELVFMEARVVPVRRKQQADGQGWVRGQGLPPGRYQLTVGAPGYSSLSEVRFLRPDAPDRALFRLQAI